jgi:uncharacterized LabA/DUF88 family protein
MLHEAIGQRDPVALLVDGENFHTGHATKLLEASIALGPVTIRRVFGKSEQIRPWDDQGFRLCPTRPGKNSADMLLCVQAMRLALRENFKTIVIASSDRDFTYLAEELRELGVTVVGVGKPNAAISFQRTCTQFIALEPVKVAVQESTAANPSVSIIKSDPQMSKPKAKRANELEQLLSHPSFLETAQIIFSSFGSQSTIPLNLLGSKLQEALNAGPKPYGGATWTGVLHRHPDHFEIGKAGGNIMVRLKT